MAHKGYTINYFINFFKNIPDHRWTRGEFQKDDTVQKCALGHCLTDQRSGEMSIGLLLNAKGKALSAFLDNKVPEINDGLNSYYQKLGATPRGRILRALRNRKRTGNIFGDKQ